MSLEEFFNGIKMGKRWMNFMKENESLLREISGNESLPSEITDKNSCILEYYENKVKNGYWSLSENFGFLAGMCSHPIRLYKWGKET